MDNWIVLIVSALIPSLLFVPCAELLPRFTAAPPDPFYVLEGNNITFVWQYNLSGAFDRVIFRFVSSSFARTIVFKRNLNIDAAIPDSDFQGRIQENINATRAEITIFESQRSESGEYEIEVTDSNLPASDRVTVQVQYPPEFNNVSSDVVVVEGDPSITLECIADGEPTPTITWTKVYAHGSDSVALGTGNQFVLETNRNNSGKYRCTAYNGMGTAPNRTVKVEVNYIPENVKLMVNDSVVCKGDVISITCSADGKPAVHTYQLFENERSVNDGNSSAGVWIRKYLKGGDLSYRCVANNTVGTAEKTVNVTVKDEPKNVRFTTSVIDYKACQGDTISFNCSADAKPVVMSYHLSKNNTAIDVSLSGMWSETLAIVGVLVYKCVAENSLGTAASTDVTVTVNVPSSIQAIDDKKVIEGDNVTLICNVSGMPSPMVSWMTPDSQRVSGYRLEVTNIDRSQAGEYTCEVSNDCGNATETATIDVQYKPENVQLTSSVVDNKACKGEVISFNCSANANPEVTSYQLFENQSAILNTSTSGMWGKHLENKGVFVFKCVAKNSLGSAYSTSVTVAANVPSSLQVIDDKRVIEGDNVTLLCRVSGMPSSMVSWMTPNGQRHSGYMLEVKSINRSQAGEYKCEAINECGNATKTASIYVQFKLPGNPCLVECTNGRACREFGKHFCLCPKGKKGKDCKENDTVATVIKISLKINNKKWREELTDLSDLDTQLFVETITRSVGEEFKGSGVIEINVIHLREGSVIADISLTFDEAVGESEVESLLLDAFNNGSLGNLKVDTFSVGSTIPDSVTVPGPVPSEPAKVNKDVIYGSVIGVLALILAVIIIFTAWKRRQREKDDRLDTGIKESREPYVNEGFELESRSGNLSTVVHHGPGHYMDLNEVRSLNEPATDPARCYLEINEYAPLHPGTRSWEVERENVTIEKVIGKGAFGQVAQGKASNLRGREETMTVAIKMLKGNATDTERKDLLSELEVMKKLKPHPHVIRLLGCVTESDPLLVLIEYVPYGDLLGYLRKSRQLEDNYFKDPDIKPQTSLTSQQLMKFSWQVADGMHYLSSKNIIHRDLAARNVLVEERERCKVTDFGMARDVCQENIYERKSKGRLPVKWTACEALLYGRYTTKSDVWSFGIVLYEIFTIGGSPYPKIHGRKMADLLTQGYRMPKPRHVDKSLYKIMQDCWQENPDDRPMFENLRNDLKEMENQHQRLINMKHYDNILYAGMD